MSKIKLKSFTLSKVCLFGAGIVSLGTVGANAATGTFLSNSATGLSQVMADRLACPATPSGAASVDTLFWHARESIRKDFLQHCKINPSSSEDLVGASNSVNKANVAGLIAQSEKDFLNRYEKRAGKFATPAVKAFAAIVAEAIVDSRVHARRMGRKGWACTHSDSTVTAISSRLTRVIRAAYDDSINLSAGHNCDSMKAAGWTPWHDKDYAPNGQLSTLAPLGGAAAPVAPAPVPAPVVVTPEPAPAPVVVAPEPAPEPAPAPEPQEPEADSGKDKFLYAGTGLLSPKGEYTKQRMHPSEVDGLEHVRSRYSIKAEGLGFALGRESVFKNNVNMLKDSHYSSSGKTGMDMIRAMEAYSARACIPRMLIAAHGYGSPLVDGTRRQSVAKTSSWRDSGRGFALGPLFGGTSYSGPTISYALKDRVESGKIRFCGKCEIYFHACSISQKFASAMAKVTGCNVVAADHKVSPISPSWKNHIKYPVTSKRSYRNIGEYEQVWFTSGAGNFWEYLPNGKRGKIGQSFIFDPEKILK